MTESWTLKSTTALMSWGINHPGADWTVLRNDEGVGRIYIRTSNPPGSEPWAWFVTRALPEVASGIAWTLDEAKRDWREAWDRIVAKHGEAAVDKALETARAARQRQDAWSEKHGPRRA
jgi:homospermidine synthase